MTTAVTEAAGRLLPLFILAAALGLDAFSLGLGIGMKGIRLLNVLKISVLVGLFHVLMPLLGMIAGHYVSTLLGNVATLVGGALLVLLGAHMIYSSFRGEEAASFNTGSPWGLLFLALSVSIDSFSVGVSFGLFKSEVWLTVLSFGIAGGAMSIAGLLLGRRMNGWVGEYGEALGGMILLAFGLKFIF